MNDDPKKQPTDPYDEDAALQDAAVNKAKLDEIFRKDAKTGRAMSGLWAWFSAGLGVFMVLFYFYNAGILPVDTQYFLGIYVLMTYILVFINYPATMKHPRATGYYVDNLVSFVCVGMFVYLMLDLLFIQTGDGAKITFSWLLLIPSLLIPVAFFLP
ncbi:MAG: hypothetical protein KKH66_05200, partial [Proteobacteria bacterium]|nr:hypothetical protein [Pseudomonadota bacterium]